MTLPPLGGGSSTLVLGSGGNPSNEPYIHHGCNLKPIKLTGDSPALEKKPFSNRFLPDHEKDFFPEVSRSGGAFFEPLSDMNPETGLRRVLGSNRSIEAYYRHLERFQVPRTSSWTNLQALLSSEDKEENSVMALGCKNPPRILKPLRLVEHNRSRSMWLFGNPWALTEPKVLQERPLLRGEEKLSLESIELLNSETSVRPYSELKDRFTKWDLVEQPRPSTTLHNQFTHYSVVPPFTPSKEDKRRRKSIKSEGKNVDDKKLFMDAIDTLENVFINYLNESSSKSEGQRSPVGNFFTPDEKATSPDTPRQTPLKLDDDLSQKHSKRLASADLKSASSKEEEKKKEENSFPIRRKNVISKIENDSYENKVNETKSTKTKKSLSTSPTKNRISRRDASTKKVGSTRNRSYDDRLARSKETSFMNNRNNKKSGSRSGKRTSSLPAKNNTKQFVNKWSSEMQPKAPGRRKSNALRPKKPNKDSNHPKKEDSNTTKLKGENKPRNLSAASLDDIKYKKTGQQVAPDLSNGDLSDSTKSEETDTREYSEVNETKAAVESDTPGEQPTYSEGHQADRSEESEEKQSTTLDENNNINDENESVTNVNEALFSKRDSHDSTNTYQHKNSADSDENLENLKEEMSNGENLASFSKESGYANRASKAIISDVLSELSSKLDIHYQSKRLVLYTAIPFNEQAFNSSIQRLCDEILKKNILNQIDGDTTVPESLLPMAFNQKPSYQFVSGTPAFESNNSSTLPSPKKHSSTPDILRRKRKMMHKMRSRYL